MTHRATKTFHGRRLKVEMAIVAPLGGASRHEKAGQKRAVMGEMPQRTHYDGLMIEGLAPVDCVVAVRS